MLFVSWFLDRTEQILNYPPHYVPQKSCGKFTLYYYDEIEREIHTEREIYKLESADVVKPPLAYDGSDLISHLRRFW